MYTILFSQSSVNDLLLKLRSDTDTVRCNRISHLTSLFHANVRGHCHTVTTLVADLKDSNKLDSNKILLPPPDPNYYKWLSLLVIIWFEKRPESTLKVNSKSEVHSFFAGQAMASLPGHKPRGWWVICLRKLTKDRSEKVEFRRNINKNSNSKSMVQRVHVICCLLIEWGFGLERMFDMFPLVFGGEWLHTGAFINQHRLRYFFVFFLLFEACFILCAQTQSQSSSY